MDIKTKGTPANDLNLDTKSFAIQVGMTDAEANDYTIKQILKQYPALRDKLAMLWKHGYKVSRAERNSLLLKAFSYTLYELDHLRRTNQRLLVTEESLRQRSLFDRQ